MSNIIVDKAHAVHVGDAEREELDALVREATEQQQPAEFVAWINNVDSTVAATGKRPSLHVIDEMIKSVLRVKPEFIYTNQLFYARSALSIARVVNDIKRFVKCQYGSPDACKCDDSLSDDVFGIVDDGRGASRLLLAMGDDREAAKNLLWPLYFLFCEDCILGDNWVRLLCSKVIETFVLHGDIRGGGCLTVEQWIERHFEHLKPVFARLKIGDVEKVDALRVVENQIIRLSFVTDQFAANNNDDLTVPIPLEYIPNLDVVENVADLDSETCWKWMKFPDYMLYRVAVGLAAGHPGITPKLLDCITYMHSCVSLTQYITNSINGVKDLAVIDAVVASFLRTRPRDATMFRTQSFCIRVIYSVARVESDIAWFVKHFFIENGWSIVEFNRGGGVRGLVDDGRGAQKLVEFFDVENPDHTFDLFTRMLKPTFALVKYGDIPRGDWTNALAKKLAELIIVGKGPRDTAEDVMALVAKILECDPETLLVE